MEIDTMDKISPPDHDNPSPKPSRRPLTPEEYETIGFLSAFAARIALFVYLGVQCAYSWRAYIIYKMLGWILPSRLRSVLMTMWFFFQIMAMPGTARMTKIVLEARFDVLPWSTALWEVFWFFVGIAPWSIAVWIVYSFVPDLGLFGMQKMVMESVYGASTYLVPTAILFFVLTKQAPEWWNSMLERCIGLLLTTMEWAVRSPIFGVLVRLIYARNGFLVEGRQRWQRRTLQSLRADLAADMPFRAAYQYDAVQEGTFRLLRVKRPWDMTPFECELVAFDLEAKIPEYTAVSYAWGPDPARPKALGVNGRRLQVTESAYQVVHGLTPEKGERYIWVDFICINQEDVIERANQVKRMRLIYAKASQVTIMLNTVTPVDYDDSDRVTHHLKKLNANLEHSTWKLDEQVAYFQKVGTYRVSAGWEALTRLFQREYWTRAWIVQEIALAQKIIVVYGDNELPWKEIASFARAFHNPDNNSALDVMGTMFGGGSVPISYIMKILQIDNMREAYRADGVDILDLLFHGWQFNATDPRDNIFAFQGLTREEIPPGILPNYQQSVLDLFLNVTYFLMARNDRPLWFLKLAGRGFGDRSIHSRFCSLEDEELPSWVPNWSELAIRAQFFPIALPQFGPKLLDIDPTGKVLLLEAISYDTIVHTTVHPMMKDVPAMIALELKGDMIRRLVDIGKDFKALHEAFAQFVPEPYPTGIPREEVLWRVLLGETSSDPDLVAYNTRCWALLGKQAEFLDVLIPHAPDHLIAPTEMSQTLEEVKNRLAEYMMSSADDEAVRFHAREYAKFLGEDMFKASTSFMAAMGRHSAGRKIAFTRRGHVVLVPPLAREGDEVAYLVHGETPFVLRAMGSEGSRKLYELVGDSYVHGVGWDDFEAGREELRPIAIA
ncbi:heterokaryon incompatibility protein [Paraphaeosphaeria sporulosa]